MQLEGVGGTTEDEKSLGKFESLLLEMYGLQLSHRVDRIERERHTQGIAGCVCVCVCVWGGIAGCVCVCVCVCVCQCGRGLVMLCVWCPRKYQSVLSG